MRRHVYTFCRAGQYLTGTSPDALGAVMLLALQHPGLVWAGAIWMLNAILGQIFVTVVIALFVVYVWGDLSPRQRRAIRETTSVLLPDEVSRYLGIAPDDACEKTDPDITVTGDELMPKHGRRRPSE